MRVDVDSLTQWLEFPEWNSRQRREGSPDASSLFAKIKRWHPVCSLTRHNLMKKNQQILKAPQKLSLGDLILAVSSCTKSTKETVAAVADLLGSGRVRVESDGRLTRACVY